MLNLLKSLHNDESGAAFIEYTALLGVILAVGLAILFVVGGWANDTWQKLATQLPATNTTTTP